MWRSESIGNTQERWQNEQKYPMDFVHGIGNGKNRHGQQARSASMLPMPGKSSRGSALQPAGAHLLFLYQQA